MRTYRWRCLEILKRIFRYVHIIALNFFFFSGYPDFLLFSICSAPAEILWAKSPVALGPPTTRTQYSVLCCKLQLQLKLAPFVLPQSDNPKHVKLISYIRFLSFFLSFFVSSCTMGSWFSLYVEFSNSKKKKKKVSPFREQDSQYFITSNWASLAICWGALRLRSNRIIDKIVSRVGSSALYSILFYSILSVLFYLFCLFCLFCFVCSIYIPTNNHTPTQPSSNPTKNTTLPVNLILLQ